MLVVLSIILAVLHSVNTIAVAPTWVTSSFVQAASKTIITTRTGNDREFPHHLNSFDNVPIHYTKGALTNLTVVRSVNKFYYNSINYTAQCMANGYTYNRFTVPLSNFKILLFLTSLFHSGQSQLPNQTLRPLDLRIFTGITSSTNYFINATYTPLGLIHRLHFSIICFCCWAIGASVLGNFGVMVYELVLGRRLLKSYQQGQMYEQQINAEFIKAQKGAIMNTTQSGRMAKADLQLDNETLERNIKQIKDHLKKKGNPFEQRNPSSRKISEQHQILDLVEQNEMI